MTVPPITYTAVVRQAASGRWCWSCCHPSCDAYRSDYLTEHSAQRDAYEHEKGHR